MDASFEAAAKNADEILNWIAAQDWCNGNIGMFGDSFQAMIQFAAAAQGNPHLKAIFPASSSLDNYSAVVFRGGVYNKAFGSFFSWATSFMESGVLTPVDSDPDGVLLAQARKERSGSTLGEKSADWFRKSPFRDSLTPDGRKFWALGSSLYPFIEGVNRSGVPVYMTTGWYDIHTADMFLWYANLTAPRRLVIRPVDHSQVEENHFDLDYGAEAHRWFDYWLKGIDNGIMNEPPIYYYLMGGSKKDAWRTGDRWPLTTEKASRFYFGEGRSGTVDSGNDGILREEIRNGRKDSSDGYTVDYSTTSGKFSRWYAINWARNYPDMQANDRKALTYTTAPLSADVELTGHPIMHLWIASDAPDLDFFVYLEEVNGKKSTYITEGNLRASHRALNEPPFKNLGLPYHTFFQTDQKPLPAGKPVELVFDLLPTAYRFSAGSRIRVTIACADADNFETPVLTPPPGIRLLRGEDHASFIQVPVALSDAVKRISQGQ
jgi:uncharacterized protein